jgi:hypothetical protein
MRSVVVVALAGALLIVSAAAQAAIVPHVSIAGARIGMTEKQVRAVLGAPRSTEGDAKSKELGYRTVTAVLVKGKVLGVTTRAPSEKVGGTIGVGVTEAKLRKTIKGLKCVVNFGTRVCNLLPPNRKASQAFTEFYIDAGKVSRISIRTGAPLTQS